MRVKLSGVRIAFAAGIFKAKAGEDGGTPAYSASFILDKGSEVEKAVNAAIDAAAKEKWNDKAPAILKQLRAADKVCLHDGDSKSEYEGFEGNMFVSSRSTTAPRVLDKDKAELTEASGKIYSGCYVNAIIEIYAQDNKFGKRVNASLKGVQFFKDGDCFGGSAPARDDEFDDISDTGDEDFLG